MGQPWDKVGATSRRPQGDLRVTLGNVGVTSGKPRSNLGATWGQPGGSAVSREPRVTSNLYILPYIAQSMGLKSLFSLVFIQKMAGIFKIKLLDLIYHSTFQCEQLTTVMKIGFTYTKVKEKKINHFRNITIPVGCSCVMKQSTRIEGFLQHLIEKQIKRFS